MTKKKKKRWLIFFDELKERMTQCPFRIMLGESNDKGLQKMYPVTVRTFDVNFNHVMTKSFHMYLLEGTDASTAASTFDRVNNLFERYNIQWDHCMGIVLDNTNANIGERNSTKSQACQKNDDIIIAGCPCHILHNAPSKASDTFNNITVFDISNHCVDLYYWFNKFDKCALKGYYEF